jgi:hypothetical protein
VSSHALIKLSIHQFIHLLITLTFGHVSGQDEASAAAEDQEWQWKKCALQAMLR